MMFSLVKKLLNLFSFAPKEEAPLKTNILYGYDLDEWAFLGTANPFYVNENKETLYKADVIAFCRRDNTSVREYVILGDSFLKEKFENHPFITVECELWRSGLRDLHYIIMDRPSAYLKDYMRKNHSFVWDFSKKEFVKQPKKPATKRELKPEDNVYYLNRDNTD